MYYKMGITLYDKIVQWALNYPIISILVFISGIIITVPQLREGILCIYRLFNAKKNKEFVIEYADETITFEEKIISQNFDVVKINSTTHKLGMQAETEWLEHKYPGYTSCMQVLNHIKTKQGIKTFDVIFIEKGMIQKDVYFDITDFYKGASVPIFKDISEYAEEKIKDLYK